MRNASGPRNLILKFYDSGLQTAQVAKRLDLCTAWCRRVKQQRDQPTLQRRNSRFKLDSTACEHLCRFVDEQPDATLAELKNRVQFELNICVSIGTLWNTLKRLKLTLKKSRSSPASRIAPMSRPPARRS